jgi:hypothetical protein
MNAGPEPSSRREKQQAVTRRFSLVKENRGGLPGSAARWRAVRTICGSCATPVAAT